MWRCGTRDRTAGGVAGDAGSHTSCEACGRVGGGVEQGVLESARPP